MWLLKLADRLFTGQNIQGVNDHEILFFFPSAGIGCTKNYQQIEVTVYSHCVERFEGLLQRCRRGSGCSELWKNTIYPEHSVHKKGNGRLLDFKCTSSVKCDNKGTFWKNEGILYNPF